MNKDRLNFRAWNKVTLTDDEDNDYEKSFVLYNVDAFKGHIVGIRQEDFEDQLEKQGFSEDEIEQIECDYSAEPCDDYLNVDADEIEQCTGLKDNNGKLIFEGDIIFINGEKCRVIWNDEDCAFFFSNLREVYYQPIFPDFYMMTGDFKVIGNIHENPELLK